MVQISTGFLGCLLFFPLCVSLLGGFKYSVFVYVYFIIWISTTHQLKRSKRNFLLAQEQTYSPLAPVVGADSAHLTEAAMQNPAERPCSLESNADFVFLATRDLA